MLTKHRWNILKIQWYHVDDRLNAVYANALPFVSLTPPPRCQAEFLTSRYVRMHRVIFYKSNTLRKLMIRA